jgi:hypothetical protein
MIFLNLAKKRGDTDMAGSEMRPGDTRIFRNGEALVLRDRDLGEASREELDPNRHHWHGKRHNRNEQPQLRTLPPNAFSRLENRSGEE